MDVKLVSVTTPILADDELVRQLSPEELIVYIARVSNPSNQLNTETAPKLLKYLIEHKHWSPFEHVHMTMDITTRRSIAAQILRHRSFSFQEFSQRYSSPVSIENIELRKQAEKNRQSSEELIDPILPYRESTIKISEIVESHFQNSMNLYNTMIESGIAREVARDVLPLATETRLFMTGSVRSWIHYLDLRTSSDTQKEHREIARIIQKYFVTAFPNISEALGWMTS